MVSKYIYKYNLLKSSYNTVHFQALWLMNPKDVSEAEHTAFYRFIGGPQTYDEPRFTLHFKVDAPVNIRAVMYFPKERPGTNNKLDFIVSLMSLLGFCLQVFF